MQARGTGVGMPCASGVGVRPLSVPVAPLWGHVPGRHWRPLANTWRCLPSIAVDVSLHDCRLSAGLTQRDGIGRSSPHLAPATVAGPTDGPGLITHSYASNMADGAFYVGACRQVCDTTLAYDTGVNSGFHAPIRGRSGRLSYPPRRGYRKGRPISAAACVGGTANRESCCRVVTPATGAGCATWSRWARWSQHHARPAISRAACKAAREMGRSKDVYIVDDDRHSVG